MVLVATLYVKTFESVAVTKFVRSLYRCVICGSFDTAGLNCFFLRVSSGLNKMRKVFKPFCVVDVRGLQVVQAVRRVEDGTVADYMIGRLLLSATDAFRCIKCALAVQACSKRLTPVLNLFWATHRLRGSSEPGGRQRQG